MAEGDAENWVKERIPLSIFTSGTGLTLIFGTPALNSYLYPHATQWWVPGAFTLGILLIVFGFVVFIAPGLAKLAGPHMPATIINEAPPLPAPLPAPLPPPEPDLVLVMDDLSAIIRWDSEDDPSDRRRFAFCLIHLTNRSEDSRRILKAQMLNATTHGRVYMSDDAFDDGVYVGPGGHASAYCRFNNPPERAVVDDDTWDDIVELTDDLNHKYQTTALFRATTRYAEKQEPF